MQLRRAKEKSVQDRVVMNRVTESVKKKKKRQVGLKNRKEVRESKKFAARPHRGHAALSL